MLRKVLYKTLYSILFALFVLCLLVSISFFVIIIADATYEGFRPDNFFFINCTIALSSLLLALLFYVLILKMGTAIAVRKLQDDIRMASESATIVHCRSGHLETSHA